MAKRIFCLTTDEARVRAVQAVQEATHGFYVSIGPEGRSEDQSRLFHALCNDIEKSGFKWAGRRPSARQWKTLLVSAFAIATKDETELMFGLEGEPVLFRESTARMSMARMSDLIEYTTAWCLANRIKITGGTADGN